MLAEPNEKLCYMHFNTIKMINFMRHTHTYVYNLTNKNKKDLQTMTHIYPLPLVKMSLEHQAFLKCILHAGILTHSGP